MRDVLDDAADDADDAILHRLSENEIDLQNELFDLVTEIDTRVDRAIVVRALLADNRRKQGERLAKLARDRANDA